MIPTCRRKKAAVQQFAWNSDRMMTITSSLVAYKLLTRISENSGSSTIGLIVLI